MNSSIASFCTLDMTKRIASYLSVAVVTFSLGMGVAKLVRHQSRQTPSLLLLSFQNQNFNDLSDEQRSKIQSAIDSIVGAQNRSEFPFFARMFRSMSNTNGQRRFVLVREQPLLTIPGEPRVRIHVFDAAGKQLTSNEFSGGWRTRVTDVRISDNALIRQETLVVDGEHWIGGHLSHQYYVLVSDQIVPAYLEWDGEIKRQEYLLQNGSIAPSKR